MKSRWRRIVDAARTAFFSPRAIVDEQLIFTKEIASKRASVVVTDAVLGKARSYRKPPNPFTLPAFPPSVLPKEKSSQMAMDDFDGTSWAGTQWGTAWAGATFQSMFAEGLAFPGYTVLAEQAQRPEYRRFAEILSTEMTRKWIKFQSVGDDPKTEQINKIKDRLDALRAKDVFQHCIELDELFGRSHLYIDTGDTDNRDELKTSIGTGRDELSKMKVGKGSIKALRPIEPVWTYPTRYDANDPLKPDWYEPETWFVLGKEVHKTRLLKFVGRPVPDLLKPAYSFGGLSMTQMSKPYVDNWLRTRQSVSDLIHAFSVFVLKTDLGAALMEGAELLFKRLELFNLLRDNRGVMMINKETEDLANVSAPLGGLEQLQAQSQEQMAAVSSIPIVKLLGIQPTGLNASDEGGIRMFYDWILASQERRMRPNLTTVVDLIQISEFGQVDQEITFMFEPLMQLDEKGTAEVREIEARTAVSYIDSGVLNPGEVREKVAGDEDSDYASIDVEDAPDLKEEEMEGLDPKAGGGIKGLGKGPKSPEDQQGEGGEPGDEGEDVSPFQQRVRDRAERHGRGEGDFYDRARDRPLKSRGFLQERVAAKKSENE